MAILLPQAQAQLLPYVKRFSRELELDTAVIQVTEMRDMEQMLQKIIDAGAELIVARGQQASYCKRHSTLPIVEIRLTGQEMAVLFYRCMQQMGKQNLRIGVVAYKNMVCNTKPLERVLGISIFDYLAEYDEEIEQFAQRAIDDSVDIIIGGETVNRYCMERNFPTLFMSSMEDSLRDALKNAKSVAYAADKEKANTAHLETLLDYSFNGIIELDKEGCINRVNHVALKILREPETKLRGIPIFDLMSAADARVMREAQRNAEEVYCNIIRLKNAQVVVNVAPILVNEEMVGSIFSFYEMQKIVRLDENALREKYLSRHIAAGNFDSIVKASKEMQKVVAVARAYAQAHVQVLLQGEPGTELELFAQCIHNAGIAAKGPFVTYYCDGAEQVAFADAERDAGMKIHVEQRLGRAARQASNGTLYLHQIDALSLSAQRLLVCLIQEQVVDLPGEKYPIPVHAQLIASTNQNLYELMRQGLFCPELYYLLTPFTLEIAPLRKRPEDLEELLTNTIDNICAKYNRFGVLSDSARELLLSYEWPGNAAQLTSFVERMLITMPSRTISGDYVYGLLQQCCAAPPKQEPESVQVIYQNPETVELVRLLEANRWDRAATAQALGISKTTLWRRMKKLGVYDTNR